MKIGKLNVNKKDIEVRNWIPFSIEPIKGKDALKTMNRGCEIMLKTGVNYWISSGNLLGIYRDGKLIDHDTDIDVNVSMKWNSLEANVLSKQIVLGLTANDFTIIRTVIYNNHFFQLATMDNKTEVIFDVYFFYTGIVPRHAVNFSPEGVMRKPVKFINNLETIKFKGEEYPVPNHLDKFLEWKYGENWRIPDKGKVPWEEQYPNLERW